MPIPIVVIAGAAVLKAAVGLKIYQAAKKKAGEVEAQRVHDMTPVPDQGETASSSDTTGD